MTASRCEAKQASATRCGWDKAAQCQNAFLACSRNGTAMLLLPTIPRFQKLASESDICRMWGTIFYFPFKNSPSGSFCTMHKLPIFSSKSAIATCASSGREAFKNTMKNILRRRYKPNKLYTCVYFCLVWWSQGATFSKYGQEQVGRRVPGLIIIVSLASFSSVLRLRMRAIDST